MNTFDERWRALTRKAERLLDEHHASLPPGFVTRVIARSREVPPESWEELLGALSLRAVVITAMVCLVTAGFAFNEWFEFRIERPAVERTVTSELPWP